MNDRDHLEHFELDLREMTSEPRRLDRAKAIREERQCPAHEAVSVEQYEFLTRQIKGANNLQDLKSILQTLLNKQFAAASSRPCGEPAAWQWLSSKGWLTLRPEWRMTMTKQQRKWLETYDRENYSLSTYEARNCGYGDLLKLGYVADRGSPSMPDLFITADGVMALMRS